MSIDDFFEDGWFLLPMMAIAAIAFALLGRSREHWPRSLPSNEGAYRDPAKPDRVVFEVPYMVRALWIYGATLMLVNLLLMPILAMISGNALREDVFEHVGLPFSLVLIAAMLVSVLSVATIGLTLKRVLENQLSERKLLINNAKFLLLYFGSLWALFSAIWLSYFVQHGHQRYRADDAVIAYFGLAIPCIAGLLYSSWILIRAQSAGEQSKEGDAEQTGARNLIDDAGTYGVAHAFQVTIALLMMLGFAVLFRLR